MSRLPRRYDTTATVSPPTPRTAGLRMFCLDLCTATPAHRLWAGFEGVAARAEAERGGEDGVLNTDVDVDDADGGVAEFSSSLGQRQRSRIVRRARAGTVRVIVCSDGMARGMDLDGVGLVVNYDVPSQAKTYVHRCEGGPRLEELGNGRGVLVAAFKTFMTCGFKKRCAFL